MGGHVTRDAHDGAVTEEEWQAAQSGAARVRTGRNLPGVAHGLSPAQGAAVRWQVQRAGHGRTFYGCQRKSGRGRARRR